MRQQSVAGNIIQAAIDLEGIPSREARLELQDMQDFASGKLVASSNFMRGDAGHDSEHGFDSELSGSKAAFDGDSDRGSEGERGVKLEHGGEHMVSNNSGAKSDSDGGSEHGLDCSANMTSRATPLLALTNGKETEGATDSTARVLVSAASSKVVYAARGEEEEGHDRETSDDTAAALQPSLGTERVALTNGEL